MITQGGDLPKLSFSICSACSCAVVGWGSAGPSTLKLRMLRMLRRDEVLLLSQSLLDRVRAEWCLVPAFTALSEFDLASYLACQLSWLTDVSS